MDIDRKLSVVGDGRMAEIALQYFRGLIDRQKADLIAKLTGDYRQGKCDAVMMASHTAAIASLEDLERRATAMVTKMNSVEKGVIVGGESG